MNLILKLDALLAEVVNSSFGITLDNKGSLWSSPKRSYGDFSTSVSFLLAKTLFLPRHEVASSIAKGLKHFGDFFKSVSVASGGFINVTLQNTVWFEFLSSLSNEKIDYGFSNVGQGAAINLEFVSANPTGPLHLGHIRGAIIFDVFAELLSKMGFSVTREYYVNDAGKQVDSLVYSVFLHFNEQLHKNEHTAFPDGCYAGAYVKDIAANLISRFPDLIKSVSCLENFANSFKEEILSLVMEMIRKDLARLNISYDCYVRETDLHAGAYIEEAMTILEEKGYLSEEELPMPKGRAGNWVERKQTVFLSELFGDDLNRALKKEDGSWTYFASDVAYHWYKLKRGFRHMVVGLGADHAGYVKRLSGMVEALSGATAHLTIKLYNLVNLFRGGKPVKLSKRNGDLITLEDVLENGITPSEIRFAMLMKSNEVMLDFDLDKFVDTSSDNPLFYVQYAYARCSSLLRTQEPSGKWDVSLLEEEREFSLIIVLTKLPPLLASVTVSGEVHKLVFYLQEIAEKFHALWNAGILDRRLRFIVEDNLELTNTRLTLVKAVRNTLATLLAILKIEPVERM